MENKDKTGKQLLLQYSALAFQLLASVGIGLYLGFLLDRWIKLKIPLFVWLLPLLVIIVMIIKAIKDTSKK